MACDTDTVQQTPPIASVDYNKCNELIALIEAYGNFPLDIEDPISMKLPKALLGMVNFISVGINHQTTPIFGVKLTGIIDGKPCRGWDYLWRRLIRLAEESPRRFTPEYLRGMTTGLLAELLADGQGGGVIGGVARRAELVADMGEVMLREGLQQINDLYFRADRWLIRDGGLGLRERLKMFQAYGTDPIEKKISYFLAIQRNSCAWEYRDEANMQFPVNYHDTRIMLRVGVVKILDPILRQKMIQGESVTVSEDLAVRKAIKEAVEYIATGLGISQSRVHYAIWNHSRNCCSIDTTHCNTCPETCKLPVRYRVEGIHACFFATVCESKGLNPADMLREHNLPDNEWY